MTLNEQPVVPDFDHRDEPEAVLPPGFDDNLGLSLPEAPPARIRTPFDPEGRGPRQGMSFGENVAGAFRAQSIEGALAEADALRVARGGTPSDTALRTDPVGAGMEGLVLAPEPELTPERVEAARQAARQAVFDQVAYDLAPAHLTPRSVLGTLLGGATAPSNLFSFGGGAVATRLGAAGAGRVAQSAASQAVAAGVTDLATQGVRTGSGGQEHFEPLQAALAPVGGAVLGAGGHVLGEAGKKAWGAATDAVAEMIRNRAAHRAALGIDLPREALPGGEAQTAGGLPAVPEQTAEIAPAGLPLREVESAPRMPAAEPDPTAPVSREQADGRAETSVGGSLDALPAAGPSATLTTKDGQSLAIVRSDNLRQPRYFVVDADSPAARGDPAAIQALARGEGARAEAYVEREGEGTARVSRIEVDPSLRRQGIASALYDHVESDLGVKLVPDQFVTTDAARFWAARDPDALSLHEDVKGGMVRRGDTGPTGAERIAGEARERAAGTRRIVKASEDSPFAQQFEGAFGADPDVVPREAAWWEALSRDERARLLDKAGIGNEDLADGPWEDIDGRGRAALARAGGLRAEAAEPAPLSAERAGLRSMMRQWGEADAAGAPARLIGEPVPGLGVHRVTAPDMEPIQVAPVVVEASDLRTSSDAGFDPALQPRQRERAASQEQVRDIAVNLEPERLGVSAEADRGAPIVGPDAMVESGNGRVLAIRQAYAQDGEAATRYRSWLAEQGVDVPAYREPVLVRQRLTDLSPEQRRGFTDAANRAVTLAMSAPERALADARLITPDSLSLIRNANDLGATANRDFVRSFVERLPQAGRGAMATADGGLSAEGLARVRNAVLARAYGADPILSRLTEATSDEVRSISNALTAAAPDWARMRAGIESGAVRADVDLTAELLEAVTRTADLRAKGLRLDAALAQQDAFSRLPEPVEAWMRMFYDARGRRAAGAPRITEALRAYAQEASKVTADEGLALGLPAVTTRDLQAIAARRGGQDDGGAQGLLYRRRARDGAGAAAGRGQPEGPEPEGTGQGPGGTGAGFGQAGEGAARSVAADEPRPVDLSDPGQARAEVESIADELLRKRAPAFEEPDQIRQGRPVEDQGTAPVPGDARPARLEAMAQRLAAEFETVLRTGRVQPGARGQYSTATGVARVRSLSDLDTALHEIGHGLQQSPQTGALVDPVITRNRIELAPLGAGTGKTGDAEAFAELFRLYATNRAYAARTYPNATADLERALSGSLPAQSAALDRLRGDLDVLHRADSGAVVGSDVITPKPDGLFRRMLDLFGSDFVGAATADPRGTVFYAWRDALYTRMVSRQHPIGRAVEALGRLYRDNTGRTFDLLPVDDPYITARLSSGSRTVADAMLARGIRPARGTEFEGPSFQGAVEAAIGKRWTPNQWHDFGAYLTARRMIAEYERFAAGEIPNPPGKLSASDYARAVSEFEARQPTFADGAQQLYAFQTNLLQRHFDLGLFTKDYLDASLARRDYVPLQRDMTDLGTSGIASSGGRDGAAMMKAFRGSQRAVMNPLDAIHARVHELEQAAALNETKAALARLAESAGPGSGFVAEPIPANKLSSVRVDVVDALRAAGSRANVDNLDLGALIHQAEGLLGDDVFTHIFRQEPIRPGREPITFYYVNRERRALRLADGAYGRDLYHALNNMTEIERNIFVSVLQISQQVLRAGVTKSLGFLYRNFMRDQGTSVATAGRHYIPFVSAFKGLFDIVTHGGDFERYIGFGGLGGGAVHEAVEGSAFGKSAQAFRQKGPLGRGVAALGRLIETSEAATRSGLFQSYTKQARELGFDAFNAALYARYKTDDYVDFRRAGSHLTIMRRFVPFLGATVQGTDKEARALIGDMVRLEAKRGRGEALSRIEADNLKDARAAWLRTLTWGMLFGGGTAYLNSENPEWFGAAAWRRERGYNLLPFGPDGHWLSFPKPFGLVRNISDLFEYGVEYLFRQDPTLPGKLGHALADAHTVPYTNPVIDTFYNTRANYDAFRDRPIVPVSLQNLPPSEQYTRYTSEIAKGIGQATGWSPMKIDYVAKNLGGGTANDFLRNADTLIHWMQGKPGGKEKTIWDLPLLRELTQNLAVGSQATERFYKLVGQRAGSLEQSASAYGQKIASGDRAGAADYLRDLPEANRVYATLTKQGFDAGEKLMHPLILARAYNDVFSGMSRQLGDRNLIPEGDLDRRNLTLSRRDAKPIETDGPTTEKLRNELDALAMVTARNALIAYGAEGMQGVPYKDPAEFVDRIKLLSPDVARELRGRIAAKRMYDPDMIRDLWPEVKARLVKDGEEADLSDLVPHRAKSAKRERRKAMADE